VALVVDASVALKWALPEPGSEHAYALAVSGETLFLPDFWLNEATNVLWLRTRKGELSEAQARERLGLLASTGIRVTTAEMALHARALDIALAVDLSPYDALYAASR
jgi:predicted nucleic acid-binding protein